MPEQALDGIPLSFGLVVKTNIHACLCVATCDRWSVCASVHVIRKCISTTYVGMPGIV